MLEPHYLPSRVLTLANQTCIGSVFNPSQSSASLNIKSWVPGPNSTLLSARICLYYTTHLHGDETLWPARWQGTLPLSLSSHLISQYVLVPGIVNGVLWTQMPRQRFFMQLHIRDWHLWKKGKKSKDQTEGELKLWCRTKMHQKILQGPVVVAHRRYPLRRTWLHWARWADLKPCLVALCSWNKCSTSWCLRLKRDPGGIYLRFTTKHRYSVQRYNTVQ